MTHLSSHHWNCYKSKWLTPFGCSEAVSDHRSRDRNLESYQFSDSDSRDTDWHSAEIPHISDRRNIPPGGIRAGIVDGFVRRVSGSEFSVVGSAAVRSVAFRLRSFRFVDGSYRWSLRLAQAEWLMDVTT